MERKYVLSVLVQNNAGVLARVSGLFGRRGYNISSLTVGETLDPRFSRITIELCGNEYVLEQIKKQLGKLEEVERVTEIELSSSVFREFMLVKVAANHGNRAAIIEICNVFGAKIADLSPDTATVEAASKPSSNTALLELLKEYGIIEIARTGLTGMQRGSQHLYQEGELNASWQDK